MVNNRNNSYSKIRSSRYSACHFYGNNKPPFAHSPNNPIHPDHNGTNMNIPNDLRSQMHQKVCLQFSFLFLFIFYKIDWNFSFT